MTKQEIMACLNLLTANYGKTLDETLIVIWTELFAKFNVNLFKKACLEIISKNKFFPNASEIINTYQNVKRARELENYELLKASQKLLIEEQKHCYLCDKTGICFYTKSIGGSQGKSKSQGHEYVSRCICSHGKDLNKFSLCQINKDRIPEAKDYYSGNDKNRIKQDKNPFYIQTIREALTTDDFEIYNARKKEEFLTRQRDSSDEEKIKILKAINEEFRECANL